MAHGRGKKPPSKEARRPNNKGAVRFGHHLPDKTVVARRPALELPARVAAGDRRAETH